MRTFLSFTRRQRAAFSTPRSLHACSDILKQREHLDDVTLQAALIGAVGDQAAALIMTHVKMSDQCRVWRASRPIRRTLSFRRPSRLSVWLCIELCLCWRKIDQALDGIHAHVLIPRRKLCLPMVFDLREYSKRSMMMGSSEFRDWALKNQHLTECVR